VSTSTPTTKQTALVKTAAPQLAVFGFDVETVDLIKRTIAKGTTDDELALFLAVCRHTGLDPFQRQIYAVKRRDLDTGGDVMAIQIGIDGYRAAAERTGEDDGMDPPQWCGPDGNWRDVWLNDDDPPRAARVSVYRKGKSRPYVATALWSAYAQRRKDGQLTRMWRTMGPHMLAKCAEALARRAAFPSQLSNTTTEDEIQDAEIVVERTTARPLPPQPAQSQTSPTTPTSHAAQAQPGGRVLTADEVAAVFARIGAASSVTDLDAITKELATMNLARDFAERRAIGDAMDAQYALIRDAAKQDA
jgi:phage recombination protein Bet